MPSWAVGGGLARTMPGPPLPPANAPGPMVSRVAAATLATSVTMRNGVLYIGCLRPEQNHDHRGSHDRGSRAGQEPFDGERKLGRQRTNQGALWANFPRCNMTGCEAATARLAARSAQPDQLRERRVRR